MFKLIRLSVCWVALLLPGLSAPGWADLATAIRLYRAEHYREGKTLLEQFLAAHQHDATAHYYLGRIYLQLKDYDQAIEHCRTAVELQATEAEYHFCLGLSYGKKAQHASFLAKPFLAPKIKKAFETTVTLDPHHVQGRAGLANFYLQAPAIMGGNLDKAHEQALILLKLDAEKGQRLLDKIGRRQAHDAAATKAASPEQGMLSE
jgi:tetratricopeptide (TPR) repeat protein